MLVNLVTYVCQHFRTGANKITLVYLAPRHQLKYIVIVSEKKEMY